MTRPGQEAAQDLARRAVELDGIASAAIFVAPPGARSLELAAAAGIGGPALDRLVESVRDPEHPIARAAADGKASYDELPTAPGGPALRSHLPVTNGATGGSAGPGSARRGPRPGARREHAG
jgi:hypothetical protein